MTEPLKNVSSFPYVYFHPHNSPYFFRKKVEATSENNALQVPANVNPSNYPKNSSSFLTKLRKKLNIFHRINDYLLFNPSQKVYDNPKDKGIAYEDVFINTPDGEILHGYFLPAKENTDKVAIFLHGNDFNVTRWFIAPMNLQEHIPINFLIVDYRGYGQSTGTPTAEGVITDAVAMYDYLIQRGFKSENISIYGRSLGGAIGLELANRVPARCVVDQSSISSLRDIFKERLPKWLSFIARDDVFNSKELIKNIHIPTLISHGTRDKIVPITHSYTLFENANEPKKLIILEGAGHEHLKNFYTPEYISWLKTHMCNGVSSNLFNYNSTF